MKRFGYCLLLMLLFYPSIVKAENLASISCTPSSASPGDEVKCTITITTDSDSYGFSTMYTLNQNLEYVSFESGSDYAMGDCFLGKISVANYDSIPAGTYRVGVLNLKVVDNATVGSMGTVTLESSRIVSGSQGTEVGSVRDMIHIEEKITINTHTVIFDPNGGTLNGTGSSNCEAPAGGSCDVTVPSVTRSDYIFNGWSESTSCLNIEKGSTITINSDKKYYACWTKNATVDPEPEEPTVPEEPTTPTIPEIPNNPSNGGNSSNNSDKIYNANTGTMSLVLIVIIMLQALVVAYYFYKKYSNKNS